MINCSGLTSLGDAARGVWRASQSPCCSSRWLSSQLPSCPSSALALAFPSVWPGASGVSRNRLWSRYNATPHPHLVDLAQTRRSGVYRVFANYAPG